MDFHAEFFPKDFKTKLAHSDKVMLIGSCFTEQIGNKLLNHKFNILQNPHGILFNPVSIAEALQSYIFQKTYTESDLFYHNEIWGSWKHHTCFSGLNKEQVLTGINSSVNQASSFLRSTDWLMITLGSAFVYETSEIIAVDSDDKNETFVVANCHKVPPDKFKKRILKPLEIVNILASTLQLLHQLNPHLKVIFTISPVRHLREGFIENNRSKAALIQAVHELTDNDKVFYFPAYELVIDDLRDYRFYAEDMVHPNYSATNYVWEKFVETCIDPAAKDIMKQISQINAAANHKPFNPASEQHSKFRETNLKKISILIQQHGYLNFDREISLLSKND